MLNSVEISYAIENHDLIVLPFNINSISSGGIRLHLSDQFMIMHKNNGKPIDTKQDSTEDWFEKVNTQGDPFILVPHQLVLACTIERIGLSKNLCGILNTMSALARIGITSHLSAGLVGSGFGYLAPSTLTLEIYSVATVPIVLYPNSNFCHLSLFRHNIETTFGYDEMDGFYSGKTGPACADFHSKPLLIKCEEG